MVLPGVGTWSLMIIAQNNIAGLDQWEGGWEPERIRLRSIQSLYELLIETWVYLLIEEYDANGSIYWYTVAGLRESVSPEVYR
jgi:hypothetical protein